MVVAGDAYQRSRFELPIRREVGEDVLKVSRPIVVDSVGNGAQGSR